MIPDKIATECILMLPQQPQIVKIIYSTQRIKVGFNFFFTICRFYHFLSHDNRLCYCIICISNQASSLCSWDSTDGFD